MIGKRIAKEARDTHKSYGRGPPVSPEMV
jgi:hypothetical protein